MKKQIVFALKQAEVGTSVPEVCSKLGISDATFYTWRKKYGAISSSELKHMRQLEEENLWLKKLAADDSALRLRIREITETHVHYGYRQVHILLRWEGWQDNYKRIYRLYREQGLSLRLKRPHRNKYSATSPASGAVSEPCLGHRFCL